METMDIFNNDAFSLVSMTEGVDMIPNQWGRIGEMGLFTPKPIRTSMFTIERRNGVLVIIQSSPRGTDMPGVKRPKRDLRMFRTARFGLQDRITSDEIGEIRAFGTTDELSQVQDVVADRQTDLRGSIDITREYLRAGALQGKVKDADGTTLVDLYAEFGITQKEVDFTLGTQGTDVKGQIAEVSRHIKTNLKGDVMTGIHCLVTPTAWDKLMFNNEFKEAHRYYMSVRDPLRNDVSDGIPWNGVFWEEYLAEGDVPQEDGTTITQSFIPDGDFRFFPVGTRATFNQYNAPSDDLEYIGTPGQEFYSSLEFERKYAEVEVQMNTLPICTRPAVLVRGHTSN